MEFYKNSYGEEMGKDTFISLQSLIKNNDGLWKSEKQGKFFLAKKTESDIGEFHWVNTWIGVKEGMKYIVIDGFLRFGHGHGDGHRPISYCYEVDHAGIVRRFRCRYQGKMSGGVSLKSVEPDWERTVETPAPPKAPEAPQEEKKVSEWFGEEGKRFNGLELTVKFITGFDTDFGYMNIHVMEDKDGNKFVWKTGSRTLDKDQTYTMNATVKAHSEFREVKQTELTRCMKIQEVS